MSSALQSVEGVLTATADFETKSAKVSAKGGLCAKDGQEPLLASLKTAGYEGKITAVAEPKKKK